MPWFKVDDRLYSHPKWLGCSAHARALWITAGSWCAGNSHDGNIDAVTVRFLGGNIRLANDLVDAGLWEKLADDRWRFHDWDHFQPTTAQVEADRAAARGRMARVRAARRSPEQSPNTQRSSPEHTAKFAGSSPYPVPSRPDPTPSTNGVTEVSPLLAATDSQTPDQKEERNRTIDPAQVDRIRQLKAERFGPRKETA